MFPVVALGLVVAGFLMRVMMKIAAARRQRIIVASHDFNRITIDTSTSCAMINLSINGTGSPTTYSAQVHQLQAIPALAAHPESMTPGQTTHAAGIPPPRSQTKSASMGAGEWLSIPATISANTSGPTINTSMDP